MLHLLHLCTLSNYSCNKCKGKHNISICIESRKTNYRNNTGSSDESNTTNVNENNTNPTEGTTNNFTCTTTNNVSNALRYFNFEPSLKLRWCRAPDLFGSQISVTTGGFELRISCIQSSRPYGLVG